jgi:hypothetical protein
MITGEVLQLYPQYIYRAKGESILMIAVATTGLRAPPVVPFVCTALAILPLPPWTSAARSNGADCLVMGTTCTHLNTIPVIPPSRAMRSNGLPVVLETDSTIPVPNLVTPCLVPPHLAVLTVDPLNQACRATF